MKRGYSRLSMEAREALKMDKGLNRDVTWYKKNKIRQDYLLDMAEDLMNKGRENYSAALLGAKLHKQIGKDNSEIKKDLLRLAEIQEPTKEQIIETKKIVGNIYLPEGRGKKKITSKDVKKSLERKIAPAVFGFMFIVGIWFLSFNLTGSVVGNLTERSSNLLGIVLVLLGIGGFWSYKKFCR
jgi:Fe2+ transport system protein B